MWSRQIVKERGKANFKVNYWHCVLVALVLGLLQVTATGGSNSSSISFSLNSTNSGVPAWFSLILSSAAVGIIVADILVFKPLQVGCRKFFVNNGRGHGENLGDMGFAFKSNYGNIVGTMFFYGLFIFLWSMLFIIPGIVKSYEYRMIPYLLAENPDITREEAFAESKRIMTGQKWNAFVYDLSFIGWLILSIFTFGILTVFYVSPYKAASDAELYFALTGQEGTQPERADINTETTEANSDENLAAAQSSGDGYVTFDDDSSN